MIDAATSENSQTIDIKPLLTAMTGGPMHHVVLADQPGYGLPGGDTIIGKTMIEIFPGLAGRSLDGLDRIFRDGVSALVRTDHLDVMCRPMRDGEGGVAGLLIEVRRTGEFVPDLPGMIGNARATAVGTLASSVAHRLSQPLTAVSNYAAGVRRALRQPARKDRLVERGLEAILESVTQAGDILGGLRALNRRGPAIRKQIDWDRMMTHAVLPILAAHIPDGALRYDFSRIGDHAIRADRMQIEQLLITVIENAGEAVRGVADPLIEIVATGRADDLIQINIEDNGPGFAAGTEHIVFDALTAANMRSLGFGLAIGRAIVEAHGGTIWAENRDGGGAAICFTLPISR